MEEAVKGLLRITVTVIVVVGAIAAANRYCLEPYRCRATVERVAKMSQRLNVSSDLAVHIQARDNLELLQKCESACSTNAEFYMLKAENETALERYDAALATYRRALEVDRRPELYLQAGLMQLQLGETREATETLLTACRFNYTMSGDLPDPLRAEIQARLAAERNEWLKRLATTRRP
jgi:tetratricopeptide (TPR) repeat protein